MSLDQSPIVDDEVLGSKPFVFVLMPFSKGFDDLYDLGIKAACADAGAYCERVDEQHYDEAIIERIQIQISRCDLIIAVMTGKNPNVFYEVGYAHALEKRVILLTDCADDIPFDLKSRKHVVYTNVGDAKAQVKSYLEWALIHPRPSLLDRLKAAEAERGSSPATTSSASIFPMSEWADFAAVRDQLARRVTIQYRHRNEAGQATDPSLSRESSLLAIVAWYVNRGGGDFNQSKIAFSLADDFATEVQSETGVRANPGLSCRLVDREWGVFAMTFGTAVDQRVVGLLRTLGLIHSEQREEPAGSRGVRRFEAHVFTPRLFRFLYWLKTTGSEPPLFAVSST